MIPTTLQVHSLIHSNSGAFGSFYSLSSFCLACRRLWILMRFCHLAAVRSFHLAEVQPCQVSNVLSGWWTIDKLKVDERAIRSTTLDWTGLNSILDDDNRPRQRGRWGRRMKRQTNKGAANGQRMDGWINVRHCGSKRYSILIYWIESNFRKRFSNIKTIRTCSWRNSRWRLSYP